MNSTDSKIISHNTILAELTSNFSSLNDNLKSKLDINEFNQSFQDIKNYIDNELTLIENNCIRIFDKINKDLPQMCQDISNQQIKIFSDNFIIQTKQLIDRSISDTVPSIVNSTFLSLISSYLREPLSIIFGL